MMSRIITLLLVVALGCSEAGSSSASVQPVERQDSDVTQLRYRLDQLKAAPEWSIGKRILTAVTHSEQDSRYELINIGDVLRLTDGRLVIASPENGLRIFDSNGQFVREVGRRGEGPGEFRQVLSVGRLSGDSIAVYDNILRRVSTFDPSGQFAHSTPANAGTVVAGEFLDTGEFMALIVQPLRSRGAELVREAVDVAILDETGGASVVARIPGHMMIASGSVPFSPRPRIAAGGSWVAYTAADTFKISVRERTGGTRELAAELPFRPVTDDDLARWLSAPVGGSAERAALERHNARVRQRAAKHHRQVDGLLVGPEGEVWVRNQESWFVFSSDGAIIGQLRNGPAEQVISAVGSDWVIVKQLGQDGIARIEVRPLAKPSQSSRDPNAA